MKLLCLAMMILLSITGCAPYESQGALPQEKPPVDVINGKARVQHARPVQPAPVTLPPQADQPANPVILSLEEQQMLNLINVERQKAGLSILVPNEELMRLARLKAQDMVNNNYFSHISPTYGSPFDMMSQAGITYMAAAENIAGNISVEAAHESLMNSPGHRANILNPDFNQIGVGKVSGGPYQNMFVQMFIRQ